MTDQQQHFITPPPELRAKWMTEARSQDYCSITEQVADYAAQWGYEQRGEVNEAKLQQARDHQLDATLAEVSFLTSRVQLLLRRLDPDSRPKPPSLKEQALNHFESFSTTFETSGGDSDLIRRALEALPDA